MDLITKDQQDTWNALERWLRLSRKGYRTGPAHRQFSARLAQRRRKRTMDPTDLWNVDASNRALIALMAYTFARRASMRVCLWALNASS